MRIAALALVAAVRACCPPQPSRPADGSRASDTEALLRLREEFLATEAEFAKAPPEVRQELCELERARLEALGYIFNEEP